MTSARSSWICLPRRLYEGRIYHIGNCEWFDAGHFPEPDLLTSRETRCIYCGIIIGHFLQRRDLENIGRTRRTSDVRLDCVVDLIGRMRLDPLCRPPNGRDERLHL